MSLSNSCGDVLAPLSSTLPNVLLVGDSISMQSEGYGGVLNDLIDNTTVALQHCGGWGHNAGNTAHGIDCIDSWLGPGDSSTWDLVLFNFGLHDLAQDDERIEPDVYAENIQSIGASIANRSKFVIFTTTTPVPNATVSPGRTNDDVHLYNEAALAEGVLPVDCGLNDIYGAVVGYCGEGYDACGLQLPGNVHYQPAGQHYLGGLVAAVVADTLQ